MPTRDTSRREAYEPPFRASSPVRRILRRLRTLVGARRHSKRMTLREAQYWRRSLATLYLSAYGVALHPLESDASIVPPKNVVDIVQGRGKDDPTSIRPPFSAPDAGKRFGTTRSSARMASTSTGCSGCSTSAWAPGRSRTTLDSPHGSRRRFRDDRETSHGVSRVAHPSRLPIRVSQTFGRLSESLTNLTAAEGQRGSRRFNGTALRLDSGRHSGRPR